MLLSNHFGNDALTRRLALAVTVSLAAHLSLLLVDLQAGLPGPAGGDPVEAISVRLRPEDRSVAPPPPSVSKPVPVAKAPRAEKTGQSVQPGQQAPALPVPAPEPPRELKRRSYAGAQTGSTPQGSPAPPDGYANIEDMDEPPTALREVVPEYPPRALRERASARLVLEVLISRTGEVVRAEPVTVAGPEFIAASIAALRRARFEPGKRDGQPVAARLYYSFWYGFE